MRTLLRGKNAVYKYYSVNEAVNQKDCDDFIAKYKDCEFDSGLVGSASNGWENQDTLRKSKLLWIEANNLLVRVLWSYVLEINQHFQFNLSGYENVQLAKYEKGDFYDWHKDTKEDNSGSERKLSATLQLSKPEDYEGCELQLFNGAKELEELPIKNQGSLIVFRSDEWHRATPVTEGIRYSLVLWASGERLK